MLLAIQGSDHLGVAFADLDDSDLVLRRPHDLVSVDRVLPESSLDTREACADWLHSHCWRTVAGKQKLRTDVGSRNLLGPKWLQKQEVEKQRPNIQLTKPTLSDLCCAYTKRGHVHWGLYI